MEKTFDVDKTIKVLILVKNITGILSIILFLLCITSLFIELIHPLFWMGLICGSYGICGSTRLRLKNEFNVKVNDWKEIFYGN